MNFSQALEQLKLGNRVAREGWNGRGLWLILIEYEDQGKANLYGEEYEMLPWIGIKTVDGKFVPWVASQTDILAEDWVIV